LVASAAGVAEASFTWGAVCGTVGVQGDPPMTPSVFRKNRCSDSKG